MRLNTADDLIRFQLRHLICLHGEIPLRCRVEGVAARAVHHLFTGLGGVGDPLNQNGFVAADPAVRVLEIKSGIARGVHGDLLHELLIAVAALTDLHHLDLLAALADPHDDVSVLLHAKVADCRRDGRVQRHSRHRHVSFCGLALLGRNFREREREVRWANRNDRVSRRSRCRFDGALDGDNESQRQK